MRLADFIPSLVGLSYVYAFPTPSESDASNSAIEKRAQDNVHIKYCEHKNFKGRCATFWISINNDRCMNIGADFNDQISSIDLRSGFGGETGHCRFYEHFDCKGKTFYIEVGQWVDRMDDPILYHWNDMFSSFDCFNGGPPI